MFHVNTLYFAYSDGRPPLKFLRRLFGVCTVWVCSPCHRGDLFWYVMPLSFLDNYQHFRGVCTVLDKSRRVSWGYKSYMDLGIGRALHYYSMGHWPCSWQVEFGWSNTIPFCLFFGHVNYPPPIIPYPLWEKRSYPFSSTTSSRYAILFGPRFVTCEWA
jgi:hypothetical protein